MCVCGRCELWFGGGGVGEGVKKKKKRGPGFRVRSSGETTQKKKKTCRNRQEILYFKPSLNNAAMLKFSSLTRALSSPPGQFEKASTPFQHRPWILKIKDQEKTPPDPKENPSLRYDTVPTATPHPLLASSLTLQCILARLAFSSAFVP